MSRVTFGVTYDLVTEESAEHGEAAEQGWIETGATLRDAIRELHKTRTVEVDGVTDINTEVRYRHPHWLARPCSITVVNGPEFRTGAQESRALHIPDTVTNASACRIARLATGPRRYRY